MYDPSFCKAWVFLFQYTSNLLIQWTIRLTLGPVQTQVNLHSSFLFFMTILWLLAARHWLEFFLWDSGGELPQSHMRGVLAAGINTELTGVAGHSDYGIPHDFSSASI